MTFKKALSLALMAVLLIGAVCWMAPNTKGATNLITNGGFEDPLATIPNVGNWEGGTRVSSESYTGSYSLYMVYSQLAKERIIGLQDGAYYFSVMYKPIITVDMDIHVNFAYNFGTDSPVQVVAYHDSVTQSLGATNASISILSGGWRNLVFNIVLDRTGLSDFVDWFIRFPFTADGFIDDVWLSTTGAITYYSSISLNSPADDSTASSLDTNFTYTPSMNNSIVNASLWLNSYNVWQRVANTTTVTNGTLNNFTYALPYQGVYLWNVQVWDSNNYYFAPANYTLTVNSTSINYGFNHNSCENPDEWIDIYPTWRTHYVNNTDYKDGFGSMQVTNTSTGITGQYYTYINLTSWGNTTNQYLGAWIKQVCGWAYFEWFDKDGDSRSISWDAAPTNSSLKLIVTHENGTHENSYDIVNCDNYAWLKLNEWHWFEVYNNYDGSFGMWMDGHTVWGGNLDPSAFDVSSFRIMFPSTLTKQIGLADFLRTANLQEYPLYLISTINVVSNPELNAFFSMATNASTLQTETLCVNGLVNETFDSLGHVGASPYLDSQDDNTSYVQTNLATATFDQYYTFNLTTLLTVSSATLHVRLACFPVSLAVAVLVQVYLWNGSDYVAIEGYQRYGDWLTMNSSTLFTKGFNTPSMLNQMRLKIWMNLNQQVPGMTYLGRCSAVWIDVSGYGNPEGYAIHQTPYSFNPVSATYVFTALNSSLTVAGIEYGFSGFTYSTGSYNGSTLIFTSLSGITSIVLEYSVVAPSGGVFLVPFMFLFWVIGLCCMFVSPIYAIDKVKKREYITGFVGGVVFGAIGFGLFVAGLWGIIA